MTKANIIEQTAIETKQKKATVEKIFNKIFDVLTETLMNEGEVRIPHFGTFRVKEHAARTGHNPATGEAIEIPAGRSAAFKASKTLKDSLNA